MWKFSSGFAGLLSSTVVVILTTGTGLSSVLLVKSSTSDLFWISPDSLMSSWGNFDMINLWVCWAPTVPKSQIFYLIPFKANKKKILYLNSQNKH